MPLITTDNLDGTHTANLTITADSTIIAETLKDAGRYIYLKRWQLFTVGDDPVLRPWSDLSDEEKLKVLEQELRYMMKEMAKSYHTNTASTAARDAAKIEAETKYIEVTDD